MQREVAKIGSSHPIFAGGIACHTYYTSMGGFFTVDNPSVKLPEIGNLTAPFAQGSHWCGANPEKRLASGGCQPELKSSRRDTTTCRRHISHCVSNISYFRKEIFHFPEGKISPGGAKFFAPPYGRPLRFPYGHEKSSPKRVSSFSW